jgi:hypothetical protein
MSFRFHHAFAKNLLGVDFGNSGNLGITFAFILIIDLFIIDLEFMDESPIGDEAILDDAIIIRCRERALKQT